MEKNKPLLIFDGLCFFCRVWLARFQKIFGTFVELVPFQDLDSGFQKISRSELKKAIHILLPDGTVYRGAMAFFVAMRWSRSHSWLGEWYEKKLWLHKPTEFFYTLIAGNRRLFSTITYLLWGRNLRNTDQNLSMSFLVRGIGAVFIVAFLSLYCQLLPLFGEKGLYPVKNFLDIFQMQFGADASIYLPTIYWWSATDSFLKFTCGLGGVLGFFVFLGFLPGLSVFLASVIYLSLISIGGEFLRFQWDSLLVECGFLAALSVPWFTTRFWKKLDLFNGAASFIGVFCFQFLLFRLMFGAGIVKLSSGDASWRDLTALSYHFQTQPLPSPLAWWAHQLPLVIQKVSVALTFFIEIPVAFLIFLPARMKAVAAVLFLCLQGAIILTGNYAFFNILTMLLSFSLLKDSQLRWMVARFPKIGMCVVRRFFVKNIEGFAHPMKSVVLGLYAITAIPVGIFILDIQMSPASNGHFSFLRPLSLLYQNYSVVNPYGLFAVMTKERREIELEYSYDKKNWTSLEFKYKPGEVHGGLSFVAPYQPRLDWMMWFAALDPELVPVAVFKALDGTSANKKIEKLFKAPSRLPVVLRNLVIRIKEGSPEAMSLLKSSDLKGKPKYLRARIYHYDFSDFKERKETGNKWRRLELNRFEL